MYVYLVGHERRKMFWVAFSNQTSLSDNESFSTLLFQQCSSLIGDAVKHTFLPKSQGYSVDRVTSDSETPFQLSAVTQLLTAILQNDK